MKFSCNQKCSATSKRLRTTGVNHAACENAQEPSYDSDKEEAIPLSVKEKIVQELDDNNDKLESNENLESDPSDVEDPRKSLPTRSKKQR